MFSSREKKKGKRGKGVETKKRVNCSNCVFEEKKMAVIKLKKMILRGNTFFYVVVGVTLL